MTEELKELIKKTEPIYINNTLKLSTVVGELVENSNEKI